MTVPAGEILVPLELVNALREATAADTATWSNERLANVLVLTRDEDGSYNVDRAAGHVWRVMAAEFAQLVDTQESGSTRKLSDLHKNALAMAGTYDAKVQGVETTEGRARTRAIRRA